MNNNSSNSIQKLVLSDSLPDLYIFDLFFILCLISVFFHSNTASFTMKSLKFFLVHSRSAPHTINKSVLRIGL